TLVRTAPVHLRKALKATAWRWPPSAYSTSACRTPILLRKRCYGSRRMAYRIIRQYYVPFNIFVDPSNSRRHGQMTELGDAELTEQGIMSLLGHRTRDAARGYVKLTEHQRLAAARKRRAWVAERLLIAASQEQELKVTVETELKVKREEAKRKLTR